LNVNAINDKIKKIAIPRRLWSGVEIAQNSMTVPEFFLEILKMFLPMFISDFSRFITEAHSGDSSIYSIQITGCVIKCISPALEAL
jgi:hypothetical protein